MIRFQGGPASGLFLTLRRAPLFLRVVSDPGGELDALDQLDDEPKECEEAHVYVRVGEPEVVRGFIDYTDRKTRRRCGRPYEEIRASYRYFAEQPTQEIARDTERWRQWCQENKEKVQ